MKAGMELLVFMCLVASGLSIGALSNSTQESGILTNSSDHAINKTDYNGNRTISIFNILNGTVATVNIPELNGVASNHMQSNGNKSDSNGNPMKKRDSNGETTESSTDNSEEDSLEDNKMDGQGAPNVSNENSTKEDGGHMDNPDYHANILNQYRMGHPYSKVNMENTGSLDDDYNYDYEDSYIVNAKDYPCTENHYITCPMGKTCREGLAGELFCKTDIYPFMSQGKLCNGTITKDCPINQTCIINKDTQPECVPKSTPEPILVPCPEEEKTKLICDYGENCFLDKDRKPVCVLTP